MDSQQQQFCLKWNSFGSNLATAFGNLFKSESLTDVTLFCEGVSLKAHKVILAACSKHFQDLFEVAPPCPGTLVILDGTSASNMAALLEFMYKGEVHVSQDSLSSFLKAAECLQVKGLSIEHEKLAGSDSQHSPTGCGGGGLGNHPHHHHSHHHDGRGSPGLCGDAPPRKQPKLNNTNHSAPSPSDPTDLTAPTTPTTSAGQFPPSSVISPYMSYHRPYERSNSTSSVVAMPPSTGFDRKRQAHKRLLAESDPGTNGTNSNSLQESVSAATVRASVLRDGKGRSTALTAEIAAAYRGAQHDGPNDSSRFNNDSEAGGGAVNNVSNSTIDRPLLSVGTSSAERDNGSNSDMVNCKDEARQQKQQGGNFDIGSGCPEDLRVKLEPMPATGLRGDELSAASYKELKQHVAAVASNDKEIVAASLWNSTTKQAAHKGGSIATADGKKLKCPFCERLYGYETNLRAHIRQRHQGIRVPCPFCSRTFTRNNTVRRHIAREHKTELSMKTAAAAASAAAAAAAAASSCFPLPNHSQ